MKVRKVVVKLGGLRYSGTLLSEPPSLADAYCTMNTLLNAYMHNSRIVAPSTPYH